MVHSSSRIWKTAGSFNSSIFLFQQKCYPWNGYGCVCVCVCVLVTELCLILCDSMDCSPPVFSVHGISQARTLEWIAMPSSRGSSRPRDWIQVSCIAGDSLSSEPQCYWFHIVIGNTQPTYQHFSNFHDHVIYLVILLKCRFWFGRSGMESDTPHFWQALKWLCYY